jgi:hypothetical protein
LVLGVRLNHLGELRINAFYLLFEDFEYITNALLCVIVPGLLESIVLLIDQF